MKIKPRLNSVPLTVISAAISLALTLNGCSSSNGAAEANTQAPATEQPASEQLDMSAVSVSAPESYLADGWSDGGVFIEIYVRGYQDSDGDGIGDLKGLTNRLDYLADLGIEGIWLMPITRSQDHDHGYAVTDYRNIESDYGTTADFEEFIAAAHERGIGVIMDYVVNHSARRNPLFIDSSNNLAGKREWYIWSDSNLGWRNWDGNPTWHAEQGSYFYGVFWDQMPDFNLLNPDVIAYHHDSMRFWLNRGLDGFRFDAVGQLVENGKFAYESQPENREILFAIQQLVTEDYLNRYMVCEEPSDPVAASSNDACGSAFAFGFNDAARASVKLGRVNSQLHQVLTNYPLHQMGVMLGNHDAFAGTRLMDDFRGNMSQYRLAAATQLTLPGQPFLYYGEEIGMNHSQGNSGDWALRAPMSWNSEGGFSSTTPFRAYAQNHAQFNAASQLTDPDSLYHFYRSLIAARKAYPALRHGSLELISSNEVLAFSRRYQDQQILVALNYADSSQTITVTLAGGAGTLEPLEGFGIEPLPVSETGETNIVLSGSAIQLYLYKPRN